MKKSMKIVSVAALTATLGMGSMLAIPQTHQALEEVAAKAVVNADSVAGKKVELNIANYGAQANNPNFDNGPIISRLINDLPKSGGDNCHS